VTDFLTARSFRPDPSPQGLVHRFMLGLDSRTRY
jgi:hypothetical protein